jgi:hypothetical protein
LINKKPYWFSGYFGTIGIVTGEDENTGEKKAYIGTAAGFNEDADTDYIAQQGSPVAASLVYEIAKDLKS